MPKARPSVKPDNRDIEAVLNSSGWLKILGHLEVNHPINHGLGPAATQEHRAMHQIRTQEYQQLLIWMKSWSAQQKLSDLPSEYKNEK